MAKEIKAYEAKDGRIFRHALDCEQYDNTIYAEEAIKANEEVFDAAAKVCGLCIKSKTCSFRWHYYNKDHTLGSFRYYYNKYHTLGSFRYYYNKDHTLGLWLESWSEGTIKVNAEFVNKLENQNASYIVTVPDDPNSNNRPTVLDSINVASIFGLLIGRVTAGNREEWTIEPVNEFLPDPNEEDK